MIWFTRLRRKCLTVWSRFTRRFPRKSIGYILRFLPKNILKLLGSVVSMACAGSLAALIAVLVGKLTDEGFLNMNPSVIWWAPVALLTITAANGLFEYAGSYLLQNTSQTVLNDIRTQMFRRMIRWEASAYQEKTPGLVHTTFLNQAANALLKAAGILTILVRDSLSIISLVCVLLWHDWKLTLVVAVIGPVIALVIRRVNRGTKNLTLQAQQVLSDMSDGINENHLNNRVVKIYGAYEQELDRLEKLNKKTRRLALKTQLVSAAGTPLTQITMMTGVAIVVVVALLEARAGFITVGQFVTYITALLMLSPPLRHIAGLSSDIGKFEAAAEAIYKFLTDPVEDFCHGEKLSRPLEGNISVRNVSFSYGGEYALKDISFDVRKGQKIALVGASGAGKSTLVNLLPGFLKPNEGDIFFDGMDSRDISLQSLRENISIVTQEVMLFEGSIADNIAYGNPNATPEEIRAAADAAYLGGVIDSLPQGMDYPIGRQGEFLSGGQRQRLAIARAIVKKAPILLLDEATSALDSESERFIQQSLDKLMSECTSVVVAHRLSTIVNADLILVFDNGQIVERGCHEELLALNSTYATLYNMQFSKNQAGEVK